MKKRLLTWLLAGLLILSVPTAGLLAWMKLMTPAVENSFQSALPVDPDILEDFGDNVKENVSVSVGDTGYSVYVRAAVVVTWQDENGNVYGEKPLENADYAMQFGETGWVKGEDGYWYFDRAVESGQATDILIKACRPLRGAPMAGYGLNVTILAQTVQAAGRNAQDMENAWNTPA